MTEVVWSRRWMRAPGSDVNRNEFVPQPWHIQRPTGSGTYCGVNVVRFNSATTDAPVESPPEGRVCAKCLKQHALGKALPQGGGPRRIRL